MPNHMHAISVEALRDLDYYRKQDIENAKNNLSKSIDIILNKLEKELEV